MSTHPSLAAEIADWALGLRFSQAPHAVQESLRSCLLYNLSMGLAVNESQDDLGQALRTIAGTHGAARLLGGRGTRSPADASFINASLITSRGQNDTHPDVVTHIGCIVIPAVLAVAETVEVATERVLDALLVGYETIPRIAFKLAGESTRRGFRASSLYGSLGAALACSVVLGLNSKQAQNALSIATNLASGLLQTWTDGSQEWRLQIAKTSRDGVYAALLAQAGVSGAEFCLEGSSGFGVAYAGVQPSLDLSGWRTPEVTFKPYPGCAFNQAPVQALRDLLGQHDIDAAEVERIDAYMNPVDASYPGVALHGPFETASGAIMSAPFMLAATLLHGVPRVSHFERQLVEQDAHRLSTRIHVHPRMSIRRWTCELELTASGGRVIRQVFDPETPFRLSWDETVALTSAVAEEWAAPDSTLKFNTLLSSLNGLSSHGFDLALMGSVVYTDQKVSTDFK